MINSYWQGQFKMAYEMMLDMLYTEKGVSYSSEIGSGGTNDGLKIALIDIKAEIQKDKKEGLLIGRHQYYALRIFQIIRVE